MSNASFFDLARDRGRGGLAELTGKWVVLRVGGFLGYPRLYRRWRGRRPRMFCSSHRIKSVLVFVSKDTLAAGCEEFS